MAATVCIWARAIGYPEGGGHLWAYLNWALGFRSCGCEVIWLEQVPSGIPPRRLQQRIAGLKSRLEPYGVGENIAIYIEGEDSLPADLGNFALDVDATAARADLLVDISYATRDEVVSRFRRSALIDIDPGLTQLWISNGQFRLAQHDFYFTVGENIGTPGARVPDCSLFWNYTPPCVALPWWPVREALPTSPYTTVSQWFADEWVVDGDDSYENNKRAGFLPFLSLPKSTGAALELALPLGEDDRERKFLEGQGWSVVGALDVSSTPWDYQRYIQLSRGEFSCAKPSCVRLQNAWISDRTICYLASGKPAVVQDTGPSQILPDAEGLLRFQTIEDALARLEEVEGNYRRHCKAARALAEDVFDAQKIARKLLEHCLH